MMKPRTPEETMRNLRFAEVSDLEVFIRRELLEYLLQLAKNAYPNEFMGFLRERDGVFEEVLIIPGYYGRDSVFFNPWLLPHDENVKGTVHSHPFSNPLPSKADLDFFSKFGGVHLIIYYPFTEFTVAGYSSKGTPVSLRIIE